MQPQSPHPRATTLSSPRPYAQRPTRQFTPLSMTLTKAFEKFKDVGVIVLLCHVPCHILFLLISSYMSIAYIIRFRA
ncbi:hypothetical protein CK203_111556 [Vitis vinifera]|uniref:Uncharacterized protein n=1 Tax=Vitis vinifera TaxID=29760 RepID=A0A438BQM3_VITVI|nr:hypothetical protein CK203_111556 [Vitis vinifera]